MIEETDALSIAKRLAEDANRRYEELVRQTAQRTVRWEWASFSRYSLEPCYFELNKIKPGELLDGEPDENDDEAVGYAFDEDDNIICERNLTGFPGEYYETFYVYEPDGIARYYYDYGDDHDWITVTWMTRDGRGRISRIDMVTADGIKGWESFEYDERGRMIRVRRQWETDYHGDLDDIREVEYDEMGNVKRTIWFMTDGSKAIDFERPGSDRTLSSSYEKLRLGLTEAILSALKEAGLDSPVYAVSLDYCDALYQSRLPPAVAFAVESDLERFRTDEPEELPYFAWNAPEWGSERALELRLDDELEDRCRLACEDIWQNELYDEVDALLWDIASSIAESELPVPRSEIFTAYVNNLDYGEPVPNVRRAASAETLAILSQKGLV